MYIYCLYHCSFVCHIIMKKLTSDCLIYEYKRHKVIKVKDRDSTIICEGLSGCYQLNSIQNLFYK